MHLVKSFSCRSNPQKKQGFTLIELMITVGIAAIIAMIAIPAYDGYIKRVYRGKAKSALETVHGRMIAYHGANNYTYTTATVGAPGLNNIYPDQIPVDNPMYTLTLTDITNNTFTLVATPNAAGRMEGDGHLKLDYRGLKNYCSPQDLKDDWIDKDSTPKLACP